MRREPILLLCFTLPSARYTTKNRFDAPTSGPRACEPFPSSDIHEDTRAGRFSFSTHPMYIDDFLVDGMLEAFDDPVIAQSIA